MVFDKTILVVKILFVGNANLPERNPKKAFPKIEKTLKVKGYSRTNPNVEK